MLSVAEQEDLELHNQDDAVVFVPATSYERLRQVSLNLLGSFVVNSRTRRGPQLVLADAEYPVKASIHTRQPAEAQRLRKSSGSGLGCRRPRGLRGRDRSAWRRALLSRYLRAPP